MCQTLFFIPAKLAAYPVFGPGLLLAVWAVVSIAVLAWLVWRQGWTADTLGYVPLLLLVGAIIGWVMPAICEPEGLPIRGYGVMIMLAVVAGTALAVWRARRVGVNPEMVYSLVFWLLVPGIIGARLFYVIHFWPEYALAYTDQGGGIGPFLTGLWVHQGGKDICIGGVLNVARGGLVVYGAFFGGVAGLLLFVRKHHLPLLAVCDLMAPSMALGVAIGRIGCLMNGCCFGAVCDHPWAITFPAGTPPEYTPPYRAQVERGQFYGLTLAANPKSEARVLAVRHGSAAEQAGLKANDRLQTVNAHEIATCEDAYSALGEAFAHEQPLKITVENKGPPLTIAAVRPPGRSLPVHPTQLYSVVDGLLICVLLLVVDRFRRRDGVLFALMMSTYPVSRFFIESLRSDEAEVFGTRMSIAQNVSIALLVCAVALWIYILRQPKGLAFARPVILSAAKNLHGRKSNGDPSLRSG